MRLKWIIVLIFLCSLLVGCDKQTGIEYIRQPKENIEKIDLIYNRTGEESTLLYTLTGEQLENFMEILSAITIREHWKPHGTLGYLVICLSYKNGDVQMIGTQSSAYKPSENELEMDYDNWHYISYSEAYDLFIKYVDEEILSSMN